MSVYSAASGVWGSGGLGGAGLHHHRLLASQGGTGPASGCQIQIKLGLVLADQVPDAAACCPGSLVNGGPHIRRGRFSLTGSALHDHLL